MTEAALPKDYTMSEVAQALGMSERWVRAKVAEGAVHNRYGNKIRFTTEQVELLRSTFTKNAAPVTGITTGRKRRSA